MLISERIYQYMLEKNISQLEFAKRTGISQSTVSDWRRKGTNPSADKIMIICEVLNVSPYELLQGTKNEKHKDYTQCKQVEYVTVNKRSREFVLVETYQKLDVDAQKRLEDYMKALIDNNDRSKEMEF